MATPDRRWHQVELKVMPGAEAWVLVRSGGRTFKLPIGAAMQELIDGIEHRWSDANHRTKHAEATVRVPLALWLSLTSSPPSTTH